MIKLYQIIFILACGAFLSSCQDEQAIQATDQTQDIEVQLDPESVKTTETENGRTSADMVNLYRIRLWLNRDQWAGGSFRFVLTKANGDLIVRSAYAGVPSLTTNAAGYTRVSFVMGGSGLPIEIRKKYKVSLEFTHPHDDVGKVYSWASNSNQYLDGCGPSCAYDLTFETSNITNGSEWQDETQLQRQQCVVMNGYTSKGQEFYPQ